MLNFLKDHPFAVEAFFESSIVLTFSVPKDQVIPLLPECLAPDTLNDQFAFIAVAIVKTKNLRPKGFPEMLGNDFILIGYRIFVRYTDSNGKGKRGLFILKSETNKKSMQWLGNIFTHYKYSTTDIQFKHEQKFLRIISDRSQFELTVESDLVDIPLPKNSLFTNWQEARKFAGPLPFTFSYDPKKKSVLIIEGVREDWVPVPINVVSYNFPFLQSLKLNDLQLANAFEIKNIPYYWKKGRKEQWVK